MKRNSIIIVLVLFIFMSVCGCEHLLEFLPVELPEIPQEPEPVIIEEPEETPVEPVIITPVTPPAAGRFTLRYDPNSTMNPIKMLNNDNIIVSSLIYESLFVLDENLFVVPLLCSRWESEDFQTFIFYVKANINMHDGSELNSADVVYSFKQAINDGRFVNRLYAVSTVEVEDDLSFKVTLKEPNYRLTALLDFPIIKNGSMNDPSPPGTGPYTLIGQEVYTHLSPFEGHRNADNMPVSRIYLRTCNDNELTELFDEGILSMLWDDPADTLDIRLNRLHETRLYETTVLQFIGFNANAPFLGDPDIRRGISASIERQIIVDEIIPGQSLASPLAISPAFEFYDLDWEYSHMTPFQELSYLFERAGLADYENTSFIGVQTSSGFIRFTIDFIVNIENAHKVQAAYRIRDTLRNAGVDVTVRELPWDMFMDELKKGNFGMYYGEIVLGGDFDLTPLLLPGPLNYGKTANAIYKLYVESFLSARGEREIEVAARLLLEEIKINAPFAPILYKRYAIYSPLGAISGAEPNQSAIFHNFSRWVIDLDMLTTG